MKKKIALLMAMVMLFAVTTAGTLAWLMDDTDPVVNTFTVGDVKIELTETMNKDTNDDGENDIWEAQLVPGKEYAKDPIVKVDETETNVDVWLFVTFDPTTSATYLDYTSNLDGNGWTKLEDGVYYREVKVVDSVKEWHLLANDKVTVKADLEKENMPTVNPTMTYKAYAIQTEGFTAAQAWAQLKIEFGF